jgi:hypothetical protein
MVCLHPRATTPDSFSFRLRHKQPLPRRAEVVILPQILIILQYPPTKLGICLLTPSPRSWSHSHETPLSSSTNPMAHPRLVHSSLSRGVVRNPRSRSRLVPSSIASPSTHDVHDRLLSLLLDSATTYTSGARICSTLAASPRPCNVSSSCSPA